MSQQWYYSKNGQQHGPVSSKQLKELAASGQLQPTDLVWKEGMGQWVAASSIEGLFATPQAPSQPPSPPPVPPNGTATSASTASHPSPFGEWYRTTWIGQMPVPIQAVLWLFYGFLWIPCWYFKTTKESRTRTSVAPATSASRPNTQPPSPLEGWNPSLKLPVVFYWWPIIAALMLFCFPFGLYLVWTHPLWIRRTKMIWIAACLVVIVPSFLSTIAKISASKAQIAEANRLWMSGDQAKAVLKYREALDRNLVFPSDRSLVVSRVVDYDVENGQVGEARGIATTYLQKDVDLRPETVAGKALIAQLEMERQRQTEEQKREQAKRAAEQPSGGLGGFLSGRKTFDNVQEIDRTLRGKDQKTVVSVLGKPGNVFAHGTLYDDADDEVWTYFELVKHPVTGTAQHVVVHFKNGVVVQANVK